MNFYFRTSIVALLTLVGLSFGLTANVQAQTIQISPISVEMLPGQMATTLFVTNKGSAASTLQVRPFQWSQTKGIDQLTETDDLMVSPPIANIAAGETQIFRLVLRSPAGNSEATYRLLLDQLPPPAIAGAVRIALRFSIPVFAEPPTIVGPQIDWQVDTGPSGAILVGTNQGGEHARILNPVLTAANGGRLLLKPGQTPYILPGAQHGWPIDGGTPILPGSTLHLAATSDVGPIDASVHVFGP